MPTIIAATDYGYRKVVRVCLNPQDPESVHADGSPHTGKAPDGTDPSLKPWEWCSDCRYNWRVQEFIWTGEELYTTSGSGKRRAKTNAELIKEMEAKRYTAGAPAEITRLAGITLGV